MVVWLCAAPAAAQETLTCGVPLLRTLAPGGTDTYHVTAAQGSAIVIQASSVSPALGPIDMQLSGPGVSNDTCTGIIGPVLIGAAGDFTLKVSQCGGTTGGEYTLALNVVSGDASNCGRPLVCGATPDGTGFSVPGEVDAFKVVLASDEDVVFKTNYLSEAGAPYLRLFDTDGNEVAPGRCAGTLGFEPSHNGTYTALVSACGVPATLDYRIEFYQAGCPMGPTITSFGVANAMSDWVAPLAQPDAEGRPIYVQRSGAGPLLVVEARAGHDGKRPGGSTVPYESGSSEQNPDLQVILSHPLGDGDPTVCDVTPPNLAGVPATVPFDFTSDPDVLDHIDDMGCRFDNGQGQRLGRPDSSEACTRSDRDFGFAFVDRGSAIQYCAQVASAWSFPEGDTIVAVRVKDGLGNFGQPREIVVRIGDNPATPTPTVTPSPGPTHTPPPILPTHTSTRTATRTRTVASPTATPTGPTPTVTSTPTGTPCTGDCNGKGMVSVDDLIRMVNIAVGAAPFEECPAGDADGDGKIMVGDLVQAVNALLNGCPASAGA